MADPRKTRTGTKVRVTLNGVTFIGSYSGILPGRPDAKSWNDRQDKVIVRNGAFVNYIPLVEGTQFRTARK